MPDETNTPAPRTLAAIEADILAACADSGGLVHDEASLIEAWVKSHYESVKAAALTDYEAAKADATKVLAGLETELHASHDWLTAKIHAL